MSTLTHPGPWLRAVARTPRPALPLPWPLRAALVLFFFVVPLETIGHEAETSSFTIARLAGLLLVGACLLRPRLFLRAPDTLTRWAFALMTAALLVTAARGPEHVGYAIGRYATWLQMLVFYHLARPLLAVPALRRRALQAYVAGAAVTAVLLLRGAGLNTAMADKGRAALGNQDPNVQAAVLGLAALWLLVHLLHQPLSVRRPGWLVGWPVFLLLVSASLLTGSRGGLLALLAGLVAVPFTGGRRGQAMRMVLPALLGLVALVAVAAQNEALVQRLEQSVEQGDTAGRGYLYASSLDLWRHRPLLGWGLGANEAELGGYTNTPLRDMHSIYLYALTAGGLLGGGLLVALLAHSVRSARRMADDPHRQAALVSLVFVLTFGATVTIFFFKFFWVALLLATAVHAPVALYRSPLPAQDTA